MSHRRDETLVEFWLDDYEQEERNHCVIVITSSAAVDLLLSSLRFASFFNTRWLANDGESLTDAQLADVYSFLYGIERDLIMSCDAEQININLGRIATALENIDEKTEELVTWQEIVEDIEDALGVGSVFVSLMQAFAGLFPSLDFKVNRTQALLAAIEYYGWKIPMMTSVKAHVGLMGGILAAIGAQKPIALLKALLSATDWLQDYYDQVTSPVSAFGSWLWSWLLSWVSENEGGEYEGDAPDEDEELRVSVRNVNKIALSLTVDACCAIGQLPTQTTPDTVVGDEMGPVDPEGSPPDGWSNFTDYDEEKCEVAEYIMRSLEEFFSTESSLIAQLGGAGVMAVSSVLLIILGLLAVMAAPVVIPTVTIVIYASAILGLYTEGTLSFVYGSIGTFINNNRDELKCILYNAQTPEQAQADFAQSLVAGGLEGVAVELVSLVLNTTFVNSLFFANPLVDTSDITADCYDCMECKPYIVNWGSFNPTTGIATSVWSNGQHVLWMSFNRTEENDYCDDPITLTATCQTGCPVANYTGSAYRAWDQDNTLIYSSNTPFSSLANVGRIAIVSDPDAVPNDGQPFTVLLEW